MEIIAIVAAVVGIIAGFVQLLDYLEKKKEKSKERPIQLSTQPISVTSKSEAPRAKNSIPVPLTSLIGRNEEILAIGKLIREHHVRLLTIIGPGGVGKTRLALQAAKNLSDGFDDVFFVSLADIKDYNLVVPTIAQTLKIPEISGQTLMQQLIDFLANKKALLVLDNFEQVLNASPNIISLLMNCPNLSALVTSRIALQIDGEHEFPVPLLRTPDLPHELTTLDVLAKNESVNLFVERAQAVSPGFSITAENAKVIAEICIRLEGLPLAIELAATRVKSLPLQVILRDLNQKITLLMTKRRSIPDHQQSLQATIDWSYGLLNAYQQALFVRLSVFVGSFTLDAAEAIIDSNGDKTNSNLSEDLTSLVGNSLLIKVDENDGVPRFRMLEIFREYGQDQLSERGELDIIMCKHAEFYLQEAEYAETFLEADEQLVWLSHLEQDHNNFRAALKWFTDKAEVKKGLRLAGALGLFWFMRCYFLEGLMWSERMLAMVEKNPTREEAQTKTLRMAGLFHLGQGNYELAEKLYKRSLKISEEIGDQLETAWNLEYLGVLHYQQGLYKVALVELRASLPLFRNLGNKPGIAWTLIFLGELARTEGQLEEASLFLLESLSLFKELGDRWGIAQSSESLGHLSRDGNKYEQAKKYYQEGLILAKELDLKAKIAVLYVNLSEIEYFEGNYSQAEALCYEGLNSIQGISYDKRLVQWRGSYILGNIAFMQGYYRQAQNFYEESLAAVVAIDANRNIARSFFGLGKVLFEQGQVQLAISLLASTSGLLTMIDATLMPLEIAQLNHYIQLAKSKLGEEIFARVWEQGLTRPLDQTIAVALGKNKPDNFVGDFSTNHEGEYQVLP